ncbi:hypothetical protein [Bacillus andreraoultii]|uniref:hypothetical protein n=1 Tax=Bacillus andreraoultii TaxID=1499685 RepID=UPI00053B2324|nr:hypothetical protein [Bacillus andreraoultii]
MRKKIAIILCAIYVVFMAITAVLLFSKGNQSDALIALAGVVCGLVPIAIILFTKFELSLPIIIFYLIFLFGSQYLGSLQGFYRNGWWDSFMHFISGMLIAYFGYDLYKRLLRKDSITKLSPWFVFLFVLSFSVFGGVLWEVYEFSMDQLFDMGLQGGGNTDTMTDLIADTIGGFVISIWTYVKVKTS